MIKNKLTFTCIQTMKEYNEICYFVVFRYLKNEGECSRFGLYLVIWSGWSHAVGTRDIYGWAYKGICHDKSLGSHEKKKTKKSKKNTELKINSTDFVGLPVSLQSMHTNPRCNTWWFIGCIIKNLVHITGMLWFAEWLNSVFERSTEIYNKFLTTNITSEITSG